MSVSTRFPTANAVYSNGGFTDPNNLHADDAAYGTSVPAKNAGKGTIYSTFGFDGDIAADSTINSVKIIYEFKVSATNSVAIQRVKARISTVEEENHDETSEPLTDTIITVDITADRTWARADLLDANFDVVVEPRRGNSNTAYTASHDYVKVEVNYTAPVNVEVFPTGSAATSASGSLSITGSASVSPTGSSATSSVGNVTVTTTSPDVEVFPTGSAITASSGSLSITGSASVTLSGSQAASSSGTLSATGSALVSLTGASVSSSLGSVTVDTTSGSTTSFVSWIQDEFS